MKTLLVLASAIALATAALGAATGALRTSAAARTPARSQIVVWQFGHIRALVRDARRFELRFDPAWWLSGVTAERAAVEDGALAPGQAAPNDHYVVDEGHRRLTYVVRRGARATVLTREGETTVGVAELAALLNGRHPRHLRLLEPKAGFWIRVSEKYPAPIVELRQQYQP